MSKLYKPLPEEEKKSVVHKLRLTKAESAELVHQAQIRNLSVSEFLRRLALRRRADVKIEMQLILAASRAGKEVQALGREYLAKGLTPPIGALELALSHCIEAMLSIRKR